MSVRRRHYTNGTHGELEQSLISVLQDDGNDTLTDLMANQELELVRRSINRLPNRGRRAVSLYYRHGYTWAKVAELMGISETTVFGIRARAIERLQEVLGEKAKGATA
jgi:RNA polymerase sigma factor (sigma-70 family)